MKKNEAEKRILVIHQGALGDFVCCFPAMSCLGQSGFEIDAAQRPELLRLAFDLNLISGYHSTENAWFSFNCWWSERRNGLGPCFALIIRMANH